MRAAAASFEPAATSALASLINQFPDVPAGEVETVLVAVELVLESGNPSAEHVENVLNRLKAAPPPDSVETHLEIAEAPIADAGRYDRLREEVSHA